MKNEMIRRMTRTAERKCECLPVNGLHDPHCPLFDGRPDYELAADAIGVFVLILKETSVPKAKMIEAFTWALDNL